MTFDTSKQQKGPVAANDKAFSNTTSKRRHFSKSTATEAQYRRIIEALRRRPHTSYELMTIAGVYHPPSRVFELRAKGFLIDKTTVTVVDRDGYAHTGVALYSLDSEPENADALLGLVEA